jgi:hypothetical protein
MARGNIDFDQIRDAARQGTGSKIQMFTGSAPAQNAPLLYDADGNAMAGTVQGNSTQVQMALGSFASGHLLTYDADGNAVDGGPVGGLNGFSMWMNGTLSVNPDATNHLLMPSTKSLTPTGAIATLKTAPTGSSLVAVVNVNGSAWLTFTFAAGVSSVTPVPSGTIAANAVISLAITAIGSTLPGADLSISVFV